MSNHLSSRNCVNILCFSDKHSQVFIIVMAYVGETNAFNPSTAKNNNSVCNTGTQRINCQEEKLVERDKTPETCLLILLVKFMTCFLMKHSHYLDTGLHNVCFLICVTWWALFLLINEISFNKVRKGWHIIDVH